MAIKAALCRHQEDWHGPLLGQGLLGATKEAFTVQVNWGKAIQVAGGGVAGFDRSTIALVEALRDKVERCFHCFAGTVSRPGRSRNLGFYLGLGGVSYQEQPEWTKSSHRLDINTIVFGNGQPIPGRCRTGQTEQTGLYSHHRQAGGRTEENTLEELQQATTSNVQRLFGKMNYNKGQYQYRFPPAQRPGS